MSTINLIYNANYFNILYDMNFNPQVSYNSNTYTFPITLSNTGTTGTTIVYVDFSSVILMSPNDYFIINSNNITIDGQNIPITIGCTGYGGLISNQNMNTNIIVQNIGINVTPLGKIVSVAGWICGSFTHNCTLNNCYSSGMSPTSSGNIFGEGATGCTANNCYSTGLIGSSSGGIFGRSSSYSTANNCFSSGIILDSGGGIFGQGSSNCIANNCYSSGNIGVNSSDAGGIFGTNCRGCTANNCYSLGSMFAGGGGIYGTRATSCQAVKCFSAGKINDSCGGIFGSESTTCNAIYCYSVGDLGINAGGIFNSDNQSTCTYCYSTGYIGTGSSGIVYIGSNTDVSYCYAIGTINNDSPSIISNGDENNNIVSYCYSINGTINNTNGNTGNISESGGEWNDINANLSINNNNGNINNSVWISIVPNTPYLFTSGIISMTVNNTNYIVPNNSYYYTFPFINSNVTGNGTYTNMILTGYYNSPTDSFIDSSFNIYGYTILKFNVNVNVVDTYVLYVNRKLNKKIIKLKHKINKQRKKLRI